MKKIVFLLFISLFSKVMVGQQILDSKKENIDTLAMNNAANSMIYYDLLLHKAPPNSPTDQSIRTLIILNDEKLISIEELKKIDKSKLISVKTLTNENSNIPINQVILLKVSE